MSENSHYSGRQIAAGRTLVGLSQGELAKSANVSIATLRRMESAAGNAPGMPNNVRAVVAALEEAGVVFLDPNGGGPGVRLSSSGGGDDS